MIIYRKELKRNTGVWCMGAFALVFIQSFICIFLFPEIKSKISIVNDAIENADIIITALRMENLRLDEITDFYGLVCGTALGIGGGLFAATKGAHVLATEEEEYTAGFLLTHPISRITVLTQKLLALFTQVIALNAVVIGTGLITAKIIHETFEMHSFVLLHTAYLIMQLEIASICFGISAFLTNGGGGIGAALVSVLYVINLVYNVSRKADFLKYITPYAYCGVGKILSQGQIQMGLVGVGSIVSFGGVMVAYLKYVRKDVLSRD